jgi:hypothetical protein
MLHKKTKNRLRRQGPRNLTWALDLTFLNEAKASRPVLGILGPSEVSAARCVEGSDTRLETRRKEEMDAVHVVRAWDYPRKEGLFRVVSHRFARTTDLVDTRSKQRVRKPRRPRGRQPHPCQPIEVLR